MNGHVWVIDDDSAIRWVLDRALSQASIPITAFNTADQALHHLNDDAPLAIITDIRMPGMSGLDFLEKVQERGWEGFSVHLWSLWCKWDVAFHVRTMKSSNLVVVWGPIGVSIGGGNVVDPVGVSVGGGNVVEMLLEVEMLSKLWTRSGFICWKDHNGSLMWIIAESNPVKGRGMFSD